MRRSKPTTVGLFAYRLATVTQSLIHAVLENALVMADSEYLDANALPLPETSAGEAPALPINLEALERWAIPEALKRTHGNKTAAAEMLGITRETLGNKLKKYGLAAKEE